MAPRKREAQRPARHTAPARLRASAPPSVPRGEKRRKTHRSGTLLVAPCDGSCIMVSVEQRGMDVEAARLFCAEYNACHVLCGTV
jgi:hypothetical protein